MGKHDIELQPVSDCYVLFCNVATIHPSGVILINVEKIFKQSLILKEWMYFYSTSIMFIEHITFAEH